MHGPINRSEFLKRDAEIHGPLNQIFKGDAKIHGRSVRFLRQNSVGEVIEEIFTDLFLNTFLG